MAIFRKIHVHFWSDVFIQSITPEQKFFFLYLLTNEKTKQCGIYEITPRQISYDTGYNIDTVNQLISFFEKEEKVRYSRETKEMAIKNWEKYNGSRSPDVQWVVGKELVSIKNKDLIPWIHSVTTVVAHSKSSSREEPEGEQEPEQEPEGEEIGSKAVQKIANEVWKDDIWKEQICMGLSFKMEELKKWMALFNASVSNDRIEGFNKSKYKKMCRGWISSQKSKGTIIDLGADTKRTSTSAPLKILNQNNDGD